MYVLLAEHIYINIYVIVIEKAFLCCRLCQSGQRVGIMESFVFIPQNVKVKLESFCSRKIRQILFPHFTFLSLSLFVRGKQRLREARSLGFMAFHRRRHLSYNNRFRNLIPAISFISGGLLLLFALLSLLAPSPVDNNHHLHPHHQHHASVSITSSSLYNAFTCSYTLYTD